MLGVLAALAVSPPATGEGLYARVEQRLAANPAMAAGLGKAAAQMAEVAWMIGEWKVVSYYRDRLRADESAGVSRVTPLYDGVWLEQRDTYPQGNQDLNYLGYSPAEGQWRSVGVDRYGNANVMRAAGWQGDRLVFEGEVNVLGVITRLRQTMISVSADEYRVENDEVIDGKAVPVDGYTYRRMPLN